MSKLPAAILGKAAGAAAAAGAAGAAPHVGQPATAAQAPSCAAAGSRANAAAQAAAFGGIHHVRCRQQRRFQIRGAAAAASAAPALALALALALAACHPLSFLLSCAGQPRLPLVREARVAGAQQAPAAVE